MQGGDKTLMMLGEMPLIGHVIGRLAPQVGSIVIVSNSDPVDFAAFDVPVVADTVPDFAGPLAGILAGLDYAAVQGFDRVVTAAADTPFFPSDLVAQLRIAALTETKSIAIAATSGDGKAAHTGRHPTFGLWPVSLREDLREALANGVRKVVVWADGHGCARAAFSAHPFDPFFNVNTPDDMARARGLMAEAGQ